MILKRLVFIKKATKDGHCRNVSIFLISQGPFSCWIRVIASETNINYSKFKICMASNKTCMQPKRLSSNYSFNILLFYFINFKEKEVVHLEESV